MADVTDCGRVAIRVDQEHEALGHRTFKAAGAVFVRNPELPDIHVAYLIIAARALGLDCGPMSGFDNAKLDAEFFPDGRWKANVLCNLGYSDRARLHPRNPHPSFEEACRIV